MFARRKYPVSDDVIYTNARRKFATLPQVCDRLRDWCIQHQHGRFLLTTLMKSSERNDCFRRQQDLDGRHSHGKRHAASSTVRCGSPWVRSRDEVRAFSRSETLHRPSKRPCLPPISYSTLPKLLDKSPDEILTEMVDPNFQLNKFLNDKRMLERHDWIVSMTQLLDKITQCTESRERLTIIFEQMANTRYLEGIYDAVRHKDSTTDQLNFTLILSFLHVSETFLTMMPHSAEELAKVIERIELQLTKCSSESKVRAIVFKNHSLFIHFRRNSKMPKMHSVEYWNEWKMLKGCALQVS